MQVLRKTIYSCIYTFILAGSMFVLSAQTPANREYQVKAVFLFNFTQFIEWPASTLPKPNTPFVIGILGTDYFGSHLDQTVSGESINGHPLVIHRYKDVRSIQKCHILFISHSETNITEITSSLKGRNILTVSDVPNFIQKGGMIRFVTINNKIRFQINPKAAEAESLSINSKLLRLAEIVVPE